MQRDKGYPIAREPPPPHPCPDLGPSSRKQVLLMAVVHLIIGFIVKDSLPGILLQKVLASQDAKVQLL